MTLEDKIMLCEGADFWHTRAFEKYGIPSIMMTDGPHGLRKVEVDDKQTTLQISNPATCFPPACATGSSWDRDLLGKIGHAIAKEAHKEEVSIVLGPGINIKRNPLCGRNFEYFSEDPLLAGELGAAFIKGLEDQGIAASLKHFAANSQESKRYTSDSIMDERTLREIYLAGFETAVKKGKPQTVMCAYNKLNGTYCSSNEMLLTTVLRKEWGFDGLVMTDWGAIHDKSESFMAGCDLEMPGGQYYFKNETMKAVNEGRLSEQLINESVDRILTLIFTAVDNKKKNTACDMNENHKLARKAAAESAVLLKNEKDILPLKTEQKIAVIGQFARHIRYQGTGSSLINPANLTNVIEAFDENKVDYSYYEGCHEDGSTDDQLMLEAINGAKNCHVAVVFAGLTESYESEGFDRESMNLPDGHLRMIAEVAKANKNTIVVLMAGSPFTMPFIHQVKAVLHMHLPGEAGGEAVFDILFGRVNPSGKLSESYPLSYEDVPSAGFYENGHETAEYREGIYVGYRYYDKAKKEVLFPFGYGLSYTAFTYSAFEISSEYENLTVSLIITNTGSMAGAEVVQLYIGEMNSPIHRPVKELKGFEKQYLEAGESKRVKFCLDKRSFSFYDVNEHDWKVNGGSYTVSIGASSRDIRLSQIIELNNEKTITSHETVQGSWYETMDGKPEREDLEMLIGKKIEDFKTPIRGEYTVNHSISDMKKAFVMKFMYFVAERVSAKKYGKVDYTNPSFKMDMAGATEIPLKNLCLISGGVITKKLAIGLVQMANGKFFRGIGTMLKKTP
ncbi:MAG: glycoside hydrolase family 3 C-terminal domain-containing protein [Clostridia bacterium]|nr:glycoside hydrolase family 3 C-terminal domain-containing protein [Clostridia bacterium]